MAGGGGFNRTLGGDESGNVHGHVGAARELRRRMTDAEKVLWGALRDRRLGGLKFRRQHPFGAFVLDFLCQEHWLVIEVDGGIHDEQIEQDIFRTEYLVAHGFRVLRVRNEDILANLDAVLGRVQLAASRSNETAVE